MPTKVPKATKDLARQKLSEGLGNQEVADLTGLSLRSVGRLKSLLEGKSAMPARNARTSQPVPTERKDTPLVSRGDEEKTTLDFEESPAPVEKKNVVDSALSSLKGMLGISDSTGTKKAPPVVSAKLNAKQQQFVDAATPTLALGFIALATWQWGRIGPEYAILAPDEKIAQRIVEPLIRVYARHSSFLTDINPDLADVGASLFALIGYIHASLGIYQEIKREEYNDGYEEAEARSSGNARRAYRAAATAQSESGARDTGGGYAPIQRASGNDASSNGGNGRGPSNFNLANLPDKEARQYEALSHLAQLDYQHRARRSGRTK